MADLAAGDVTYTQQPNLESKGNTGARSTGKQLLTKVTFGDGAKTVAATGVPLVPNKLGVASTVKRIRVIAETVNEARKWVWNGSELSPALLSDAVTAPASTVLTLEVEGY